MISDERLAILGRFGDSDMQDIVVEILLLRKVVRDLYGQNVDFSMFEVE